MVVAGEGGEVGCAGGCHFLRIRYTISIDGYFGTDFGEFSVGNVWFLSKSFLATIYFLYFYF